MPASPKTPWLAASAWLRGYDKSSLRGDSVVAITLAAYLLPAALGDASLANLPPEAAFTPVCSAGWCFGCFAVRGIR